MAHMGDPMSRHEFNEKAAPLAKQATGISTRSTAKGSARFAHFADDERLVIVAGAQEGAHCDRALARGLTERHDRKLVLVLPRAHAFATMQRAPWFVEAARPEIWLHEEGTAMLATSRTTADTIKALDTSRKDGDHADDELRAATTPMHLGDGSRGVFDLVEWATKHEALDAGHRRGERSWHCMGQKVLSIRRTTGGIRITAGIHYGGEKAPVPVEVPAVGTLDDEGQQHLQKQVEVGIEHRRCGEPPINKPDEHWLQAVLRADPSIVGVEQPALRELPAWRPQGSPELTGTLPRFGQWGRGFVDLLGVDGHGDIRIVETKLSKNVDELLVLQGLDYYIWASAYHEALVDRLGVRQPQRQAADQFEIHYVIGAGPDGKIHVSPFVEAQALSLDPAIRWRFQTVQDWYRTPEDHGRATSKLFGSRTLP